MSTTIDSLQIEIKSSSTNAAQGIDNLAKSLQALKKSGTIGTAVKHLNNLSEALKKLPNVHSSSNALRTLANSIEKLKGVGSIASIVNNLKKLPAALKSVGSINIEKVKPQLEGIADAVSPLSSIKAGGLSTMMNSLKKLGEVTKSLDEETIQKFADKIALLNAKLGPLSEKMTTIKAGFSAINSKARSAATSVKDFGEGVDTSALNMSSFIEIARTAIDTLQNLIQRFSAFISEAIEWDGIAARFGRGFGAQAQETYEWIQRLNEEMGINIQQFMQYSSIYATMLTGFGVANEDATKMALGYTELTYDIWAGYNDIYKSFDEASEAVRSAIAGEVEPIRRAGFTIIESTLEQTAANHGLEISLANATEAQKSYLRYLTLVDQAHSQSLVGTYAKELNTAEGLMRTFSQQLKSLTQAFGSLFLPILVRVMPWLQAFVELLAEGVYWLAGLFGVEIQAVDFSGYEDGAGAIDNVANSAGTAADALDSATKAAKELKNATIGIDELNVISPSSATSGSGADGGAGGGAGSDGFSGLDIDSLWDESIFDSVQSKVDEIKTKLKGMFDDWLPQLKIIGGALGAWSIAKLLDQLGEALKLGDKFHGTVTNIKKLAATAIIVAIQFKLMEDAFSDFMGEDGTILDYIEGVVIGAASTYLLYKMWGKGGLAIGLGITAAVSLKTVIEEGGITDMESATVAITGLASAIGALSIAFKGISTAWAAVKSSKLIANLGAFISLAKEHGVISSLAAAFPKLSSALSGVGASIAGLSTGAITGIVVAIVAVVSVITFLVKNWDEVTQAVKDFFAENISPKLEKIAEHFEKIKEALGPLWTLFEKVGQFLKEKLGLEFEQLGDVLEWLGGIITTFGGSVIGGLINVLAGLLENVVQIFSGIVQYISGNFELLIGIFTLDGEKIKSGWKKIWQGMWEFLKGFWQLLTDPVSDLVDGIIDWFTHLWDVLVGHSIVPDMINAIVDWFLSLPSKIFGSVKNFVSGIIDKFKNLGSGLSEKFSEAWNTVKSWWDNSKAKLKEYTPSIGDIKSKLSSAWTKAKSWWDGAKSKLKEYTPSIGSIYDKLKTRWDNARTWWNEKKSKLKEYTPSIGSIYEKLSARWKNARDWWNSKKSALKSYTPSIGSIVDKLKSAWNTAKSWWNKNVKLKIPSMSFKVTYSTPSSKTMKAIMNALDLPGWPKLSFAANGGIFDQGSMIWAGERGPEVVANAAGGKTGVMNVQQMADAVFEGVYSAVTAAMRGYSGGGGQVVKVYLDGREVTASVERHQHERGASIMGNEVYSY